MGYDTREERDERRSSGNGNGRGRERGGKLKKIGALWRPRPGGKSSGSGMVTVHGWKQRFVLLKNHRKKEGSNEPDWVLMSGDEPEVDNYEQRRGGGDRDQDDRREPPPDDDIPF